MLMRSALAATAVLLSAVFAGTAPVRAQNTDVRFVLDFLLQGQQSAFVLGRDRGYYTAQKVNFAAFDPGRGGADSITKVASGTHDIGFGDFSSLIEFNAKNPTQAFADIINTKRSLRLELIIVLLIAAEILMAVFQMRFR